MLILVLHIVSITTIVSYWRKNIIEVLGLSKPLLGTENGLIISRLLSLYSTQKYQKNIKGLLAQNGYHGNISYVDHHYAHACSAYYSQSIDNGIVITLDASGDGYCSKVYLANNNNLTEVNRIPCYHSPAYYYLYVTKILGFTPLRHEGKITGLAAYGDPNKCIHIFRELITFDSNKLRFVNYGGYYNNYILQLKELLSGFLDKWYELDPTIITGWNSGFFDIPYLYYRIKKVLGETLANSLSPIGKIKFTPQFPEQPVNLAGINHLDYMLLFKKYIMKQEPSYRLGDIGKKYAKLEKIEYEGSLDKLFKIFLSQVLPIAIGAGKPVAFSLANPCIPSLVKSTGIPKRVFSTNHF